MLLGADRVQQSKTADNALTAFYGIQLGEEGFSVTSICPGYCDTNFTGGQGYKKADDGAEPILIAVNSKKEDVHLKFLNGESADGKYPW